MERINKKPVIKIFLLYIVFAGLYIIFSDKLVQIISNDNQVITNIQTFKGWAFVIVSGLLIYWLMLRELVKIDKANKEKEEIESRYKHYIQSATVGILIVVDGRIVFSNPQASKISGYSFSELSMMNFDNFLKIGHFNHFKPIEVNYSLVYGEIINSDGKPLLVSLNHTNIVLDEKLALLVFFNDITDLYEANQKVEEQRSYFVQLVEQSNSGLVILSKQGICLKANAIFNKLFGLPNGYLETINYSFLDNFINDYDAKIKFFNVFQSFSAQSWEFEFDHDIFAAKLNYSPSIHGKNWFSMKAYPVFMDDDNVANIVLQVDLITERVHKTIALEESESKYRALIENIPDSVILVYDNNLDFVLADGSGMMKAGLYKNRILGKNVYDVFPNELAEVLEKNFKDSLKGSFNVIDLPISNSVFQVRTVPIYNDSGKTFYGMMLATDITQRVLAEKEVISLNEELEERIAQRTAQLENANMELQYEIEEHKRTESELMKAQIELKLALEKEIELNTMKKRFISIVTHEYRNPLTLIMSSTYIIKELLQRKEYDGINNFLDRILMSVQKPTKLLDEILFIEKESDKIVYYSQLDVVEISKTIVEEIRLIDNQNHNLIFNASIDSLNIISEEGRIQKIFSNLLTNACKYSEIGSEINFELKKLDNHIEFVVSDFGIGIPEEEMHLVFEPFARLSNSRKIVGSGLGLSIVKKAIDDLSGTISIEKNIPNGTKFIVKLPLIVSN